MDDCVVFFSDIHADAEALDVFIEFSRCPEFGARYGKLSQYVCLGDVVDVGCNPEEVVRTLKGIDGLQWVKGNHDESVDLGIAICERDMHSEIAHQKFRDNGTSEFVRALPDHIKDEKHRYYAVHGGPVDPKQIMPAHLPSSYDAWLYSRTWQRINILSECFSNAGFQISPRRAFDYVRGLFKGNGWFIVCGHDHREGCFVWDARATADEGVKDMFPVIDKHPARLTIGGHIVDEKAIKIENVKDYIFRIGALSDNYKENGSYFGVLTNNRFVFVHMHNSNERLF